MDDLHAAHRLGKPTAPSKAGLNPRSRRKYVVGSRRRAKTVATPGPGVTPSPWTPNDAGATARGRRKARGGTTRPDWAESLISGAAKRRTGGVPQIPADRQGRNREEVLRPRAPRARTGLLEPSPAETDERRKEEEEEREEEAKLKAEEAADDANDDAVEAKEAAARAKAELRAKQVAAKSRACILRGKAKDKRIAASGEFGDWPTRWRCYKPGASLKRLRDWLDDDPRNLRGGEEKRLKSLSALLVKAASHDKKGLAGDVDAAVPASQQPADGEKRKFDWDALAKELGINVDGYAHLTTRTRRTPRR